MHELLGLGADPNSTNKHGDTALVLAVQNGHAETVQLLIEHGADPFLHGAGLVSAIESAISNGNEVLFDLLMACSEHASPDQLREALYWAVVSGRPRFLRRLLAAGADPLLLRHERTALGTAKVWLQDATESDYRRRLQEIVFLLEHPQES